MPALTLLDSSVFALPVITRELHLQRRRGSEWPEER